MSDISIKEIADKAGVSVGTVDRVIHNRGSVSKKTKDKVLEIIKKYDYKPNLMARGLANRRNLKIAALLPDNQHDTFWELPLNGIIKAQNYIKSFGFAVDKFHFKDDKNQDLYNTGMRIFEENYHAVLIAPIIRDEAIKIFEECEKRKIPYVQINTFIQRDSDLFISYVGQNSYSSGKLAAKLFDYGTSKGDTLLILHLEKEVYNSVHLVQKEKGFRDYFSAKKNKNIEIAQLTFSNLDSKKQRLDFIKTTLERYPKLAGIFVTTSRMHRVISEFIRLSKNDMNFIGYDLIEENLKFFESEKDLFLINQNPFDQGYLGIITLYNHLLHNIPSSKTQYLPIDVVMKENVEFYHNS